MGKQYGVSKARFSIDGLCIGIDHHGGYRCPHLASFVCLQKFALAAEMTAGPRPLFSAVDASSKSSAHLLPKMVQCNFAVVHTMVRFVCGLAPA